MIDFIHRIVAVHWVYDLTQFLAGQSYVQHRIAKHLKSFTQPKRVLDVGAGTGLYRGLWSDQHTYICCDIDSEKLVGFTHKFDDPVCQGDGTQLPFQSASLDVVVCIAVAHHLDDNQFQQMVTEAARILKVGGMLLFLEPVFAEKRLPGRFLWMLDRGSNPRTPQVLEATLGQSFKLQTLESFAIYHRYLLALCIKHAH